MDLIYELLWYLFVASLKGNVAVKKCGAKYLLYILEEVIFTYRVHIIFRYLIIYFNNMIQETESLFKVISYILKILFPCYYKAI